VVSVRLAFSANNPNLARQISQRSNTPLASQQVNSPSYDGDLSQAPQRELALYAVQKQARQNPDTAALQLNALEKAGLSREAAGYGWGQLALINAKKLRMVDALAQFARADQKQLNREQWDGGFAQHCVKDNGTLCNARLMPCQPRSPQKQIGYIGKPAP